MEEQPPLTIEVSMIAATSADGFIATGAHHRSTEWASKADLRERFIPLTKLMGAIIVGNNTFKTFPNGPLKGRYNVVYTNDAMLLQNDPPNTILSYTNLPPEKLLRTLQDVHHIKKVMICGGASIYTQFMPYVQKMYITTEPVIFGTGVPLFTATSPQIRRMKLLCSSQIDETRFADYEVLSEGS